MFVLRLGSGDVGKEDNGVIDFSGAANKKNQPKGRIDNL